MSGDADSGTSSFTMNGGTLTSKNGHVFHVTNTNAVINLSGVKIVNKDSENILLSVCADGWSGAGNIATLNADGQHDHIWDTCVPTFLHFNIPLMIVSIIVAQFI